MFDSCAMLPMHIMSEAPQTEAKEKDILQSADTLEKLKKELITFSGYAALSPMQRTIKTRWAINATNSRFKRKILRSTR